MAIVIPKQSAGGGLSKIIMFVAIIGILLLAMYFLFFAPTPAFDYIAPQSLQQAAQLSQFDMDPDTVLDSAEFRSLRKINGLPTGGTFGRTNPFLSF
jgi:hypothetical protein